MDLPMNGNNYETENYLIEVAKTPKPFGDRETLEAEYIIRNKMSGVIEYTDSVLPRTIEALLQLQSKLDEADQVYFKSQNTLTLVSDDEERGGLH